MMSVSGAESYCLLAIHTIGTIRIEMFNRYDDVYNGEFFDWLLVYVKGGSYDLLAYLLGDGQ
jgi:hypothetical protein